MSHITSFIECGKTGKMKYTVSQHNKKGKRAPHGLNKVQRLVKYERTTTTKLPKVMGLPSKPDRRPRFIKPQHLHYYHCQKFSHLLTSTRLMIIAREETIHDTQASERVS